MGPSVTAREAALAAAAPSRAACGHCGLPALGGEAYCCYGCELAAQIGGEGEERQTKARALLTLCLLLSMFVMMLSLFLFAEDVYGAAPEGQLAWLSQAYRIASAVLATPVVVLLGAPLLSRALRSLAAGRLSMDLLVVTGAAAAYALSIDAVVTGKHAVYFDSASAALLLGTLGRYLEALGKAKASELLAPSLKRSSEPVIVLHDGVARRMAPALVEPGDRLRIGIEEVLPVDAEVVLAAVEVNLGVLTGEATPVTRRPGESVPAGAVPVSAPLECVATSSVKTSTLERLASLSRALRERPSSLQRWADRFASTLTPLVFVLATATFAYWLARGSLDRAVVTSLAVVLAACPCTFGVAAPLVFWLGLRKALEHGALVRTAGALEELAEVRTVAFDKTGTLTERELVVSGVELEGGSDLEGASESASEAEVLSLVLALEEGSRHPVALALSEYASERTAVPAAIGARRLEAGRGVSAVDAEGRAIVLGSPRMLAEHGVALAPGASGDASGVRVALARGGLVIARFRIGESLRPEAREAIAALASRGIGAVMLTGDAAGSAARIAGELGIEALSNLSAVEKLERLEAMGSATAMVGDGLNDAPALAGTGPSFAMDGGTDLARGMARVALLRPDLRLVPWTLALARRAVSLARRSLIVSASYNVVFLILAATGALRPVWAGLAMATSSLLMLASSTRISSFPGPDEVRP